MDNWGNVRESELNSGIFLIYVYVYIYVSYIVHCMCIRVLCTDNMRVI